MGGKRERAVVPISATAFFFGVLAGVGSIPLVRVVGSSSRVCCWEDESSEVKGSARSTAASSCSECAGPKVRLRPEDFLRGEP